jgi:hypothetical protein
MDRVLAIDPGVHLCAWALAEKLRIQRVGIERDGPDGDINKLIRSFSLIGAGFDFDLVIVEHPVIYPIERAKADPNDIVRLAAVAGVVGAACAAASSNCKLEFVEPRRWKGTVPKHIHNERTRSRCPEAVALVEQLLKSQRNHVWDAVALALWRSERTT